jgi:putative membrane protein
MPDHTPMPDHTMAGHRPLDLPVVLVALIALLAAFAYLNAAAQLRRRGHAWPRARQYAFLAGSMAVALAATAPMPGPEFTAHMAQHLILGMLAPLLLVLGRPITLALRSMPAGPGRSRVLKRMHSRPAAVLMFPPLAGAIDAAGLWVLYRTPMFVIVHDQPWLLAAVHAHVFAAGVLFTASVCQLDPVRRRYPMTLRAGGLIAVAMAHAVLAKTLWAASPPGTSYRSVDAHAGAQLMYYGGDVVEIALAVVIAVTWYSASGRALARARRHAACHSGDRGPATGAPLSHATQTLPASPNGPIGANEHSGA